VSTIKRILVTGGAGFLGSHFCERFVEDGHDVICVDNFFTSQKSNVDHLLDRHNFELIRHDVTHPLLLEVDEIYNLACPAAPGHYQYNPIKTMKTSVMGSINMLGLAKRCRAKILQASTSEVYGDPEVHPQPESYRGSVNPIGPRACYDEGKRASETLFMDYWRQNGVNIRIVRIFNTYGPRMHPFDGRVVSNFIRQALANEDITVFGDGSQTRSFCYRDDLVDVPIDSFKSFWDASLAGNRATYVTSNSLQMTFFFMASLVWGADQYDMEAGFDAMRRAMPMKISDFTGNMQTLIERGEVHCGVQWEGEIGRASCRERV